MLKKGIAIVLSVIMLLLVSSCQRVNRINKGGFVVGVLTGTVEQYPEDYQASLSLKETFGDFVMTTQFADTNTIITGTPSVVEEALALAEKGNADALIFAKAPKGTMAAIEAVKAKYPDMLIICIAPEEELRTISGKANLVLLYNEAEMAARMVKQAKEEGAETFVNYSFKRHTENSLFALRNDTLSSACEEKGLKYEFVNAVDPMSFLGAKGANEFMREDMSRCVNTYGKDTAFFSSDCTVQATMITEAIRLGAIVPQTGYPSLYTGFPEAFDIDLEGLWNTPDIVIEKMKTLAAQKDMTGRLSTWSIGSGSVMLEAAVRYALFALNAEIADTVDEEELRACVDVAAGKNGNVELSVHYDAVTTRNPNTFGILADYVVF